MKVEELKELSDRIRSEFRDRPRIPWPRSFKQIVVKELSNGKNVQDLSKATGINDQVIRNWQRKTQKKQETKKPIQTNHSQPTFPVLLPPHPDLKNRFSNQRALFPTAL